MTQKVTEESSPLIPREIQPLAMFARQLCEFAMIPLAAIVCLTFFLRYVFEFQTPETLSVIVVSGYATFASWSNWKRSKQELDL